MLPTKNHGRCCNLANLINLLLHLPSPLKKMNIKNINLKPDGIAIDVDLNHYARFPAKSGILFFAGNFEFLLRLEQATILASPTNTAFNLMPPGLTALLKYGNDSINLIFHTQNDMIMAIWWHVCHGCHGRCHDHVMVTTVIIITYSGRKLCSQIC